MTWLHGYLAQTLGCRELWAAVQPGNSRSVALLKRLGYQMAEPDASRPLRSYDSGDLCFRCHGGLLKIFQ